MNRDGIIGTIIIVSVLTFALWMSSLSEDSADKQCNEMIALAQTRSDTLIVYGMKPESKFTSCADRLR